MKAFLVVLLFTLTTCSFPDDLVKLGKCILSSQTVFEVLPKVVEAVKSGEYFTLLQIAVSELPKVKEEVMECMDKPVLKGINNNVNKYEECVKKCKSTSSDAWARAACIRDCGISHVNRP